MFKRTLLAAALACALPIQAQAVTDADLAAELVKLRAEFDQKLKDIQAAYEARLAPQAEAPPAPRASRGNDFNPELSLILQGSYAQRKAGERRPTGFLQDAGIGAPARGFSLGDSELILAANIDPYFRGQATVILADGQANVEEAWFQTLSLDRGLTLKGGRFISGIGYANEQHPHAWDFADNSLMYSTLFGEHLVQDGLQLKWLAPSDTFVELGVEVGRGAAFPGSSIGGDKNGAGSWAAFGHVGGDVGESNAWRAGLSWLAARPKERESWLVDSGGVDASTLFSGKSNTWIADFIWKWAPDGNPKARNFKFQSEVFQRDEAGDLATGGSTDAYRARQSGWYAQGVYQFLPRWRAGLRYDRLNSGSLDFATNNAALLPAAYSPNKWSLMADWSPSEFSRFRLQLARDHAMMGNPDDQQITVQYIHSLGAHGGHKF
ncbi:MAG: TonB-dependent receptor [Pseudomonadota bacterium]|nr:TonB-dependent receptor [Pseudomonadota bacterium]